MSHFDLSFADRVASILAERLGAGTRRVGASRVASMRVASRVASRRVASRTADARLSDRALVDRVASAVATRMSGSAGQSPERVASLVLRRLSATSLAARVASRVARSVASSVTKRLQARQDSPGASSGEWLESVAATIASGLTKRFAGGAGLPVHEERIHAIDEKDNRRPA
jgi:hypothetical protein